MYSGLKCQAAHKGLPNLLQFTLIFGVNFKIFISSTNLILRIVSVVNVLMKNDNRVNS